MAKAVTKATLILLACMAGVSTWAIPPIAVDDTFVMDEDGNLSDSLLGNDLPDSGGPLSVSSHTAPAVGVLAVNPDGTFTYTPPADFSGEVLFSYELFEDAPTCGGMAPPPNCFANANVVIQVRPGADAPTVSALDVSGSEDAAGIPLNISITPNDTDGSQTLVVRLSLPAGASLSAGTDGGGGIWTVPLGSLGGLNIIPPPDANGVATIGIDIEVFDDALFDGGATPVQDMIVASDSFDVTVNPVNDAPFVAGAVPSITTDEDVNVSVDLTGLFDDVDIATNGDSLTLDVTNLNNPALDSGTSVSGTMLDIVLRGDEFGTGDLEVTAEDSSGAQVSVTIPVTVNAVNDAPQVDTPIAPQSLTEDTAAVIDLSGLFDDPDGDSLMLSAANGHAAIASATVTGTNLNITMVPNANGSGTVDITAEDPSGETVSSSISITVNPVNDDPFIAGAVPILNTDEDVDASVSLAGLFDDVDIGTNGDVLTLTVTAINNTAVSAASMSGSTLDVTVVPNAHGSGDVSVTAQDSAGQTVTAVVPVNVGAVNDAPFVSGVAPAIVTDEDIGATANLIGLFDDPDIATSGDSLTLSVSGVSHPAVDTATISGSTLTVTLLPNMIGTGTIDVVATDTGTPALTASATIDLTVNSVNDNPVLVGSIPAITVDEDAATDSIDISGLFDDVDIATAGDSLSVIVTSTTGSIFASAQVVGNNLVLDYAADQNGSGTVNLLASDTGTPTLSESYVVNVTVNPINDAPYVAGTPPTLVTNEEINVAVDLAGLFDDPDRVINGDSLALSMVGFSHPAIDTATITGTTLSVTLLPDGNGTGTIDVVATDTGAPALTASATINLTVNSVNDAPAVVGSLAPVAVDEDAPDSVISLAGLFDDPDIATAGDSLTLSVTDTSLPGLFASASVIGSDLVLDYADDQNGVSTVTITATDSGTPVASVDYVLSVTVNAVNDAPVATTTIADMTMAEDDPPLTFSIDVFDDVDEVTNGDVLSFSVTGNTDPSLFSSVSLVGDQLTLTLAANQNGTSDITITATDSGGASVDDTFTLNVVAVNDMPIANADTVTTTEGSGEIVISVLGNDFLAEEPTTITAVGATGEHTIIDPFDDPVVSPNGFVTIDGSDIRYEPNGNFFGTDTFTYTITDADGDMATGTVTVTVTGVNDPPISGALDDFRMLENQTLTVDAANGAASRAWDVDGKMLDDMGVELGSPILAQIETLPAVGALTFNADGSFEYTPPINYTGTVEFTYRLFDNIDLSALPAYTVRIYVDALPPPPPAPPAGQVATPFNIAQTPLEQAATVPPNVLVVMDDSGSMDWHVVMPGGPSGGGLRLNNDPINNRRTNITDYYYLWDLGNFSTFPTTTGYGYVVPDQASVDAAMPGNAYQVWQARSSDFNKIYYDPTVYYPPWTGQDRFNNEFTDADPAAIRLDPVDPGNTFDLTAPHSYTSRNVPEWDTNGGRQNVNVTIPNLMYYWADASTQVVIEASRTTYPGGPNREDCRDDGNPNVCTYAQERQNFANWFQYYRSREFVTKGSMGAVIANIQDVRIGYETISARTSEQIREMNDLHTEGNKKLLMDNIYSIDSFGGTPLRQALGRAGQIFSCATGPYCPALPAPEGQCQQNFALLFSDGYWNGGTGVAINADEDGAGPFDGGRYADTVSRTLADVAMHYYETDLFPAVDDGVPVSLRDVEGAPTAVFDGVEFMHQHMKTYAIAFGIDGTFPATDPQLTDIGDAFAWSNPFDGDLQKVDDMVHAALNGRGAYYSAGNPQELRAAFEAAFLEFTQAASSASAAAFNSTSLREDTLLYRGFYDLRDRTGELTATEVSTAGVLASTPTWFASEQLDPANKLPSARVLVTYNPASNTGVPFRYGDLATVQQNTIDEFQVDYVRGERGNELPGGWLRERPASGGLLGPIVNSSPVFVGAPRAINRDQAPFPTDDLYSTFQSNVYARTPLVYVGANDGILHGFDAETGEELFGYVPNKILDATAEYSNKLNDYTSPFYFHSYYVDLSPRLNDVYMRPSALGSKQWMTALVGGLGAGGKGFFALNVNDPDTMFADETTASAAVLWEFTDEDDTYPEDAAGVPLGGSVGAYVDPNGDPVKDLGYATSLPVVQMTNATDGGTPARNEWAAIFGNGVNSTAGIAKLFVLFMDRGVDGWGSGDFVKIDTGYGVPLPGEQLEGYPNGLGAPTAVDADLNGTVDYVYAGDRLGNLFRFDLTSDDPDDWEAVRLFTATYDDGVNDIRQPILSRPLVVKNPDDVGFIVIFGTGSYLSAEDARNTEIQSIYGIWDRLTSAPATAASNTKTDRLVEQTITNVVDDSLTPAVTRRIVSKNTVTYVADGVDPGTYGWYIDLDMQRAVNTLSGAANTDDSGLAPPDPQFPGERAIRRMVFRNGAVITTTVIPATDETSCFGTRAGAILVFDAFAGGDADQAIIDFNTDGVVDSDDLVEVGGETFSGGLLFDQSALDGTLVDLSTLGGEGEIDFLFVSGGNDTQVYRIADINAGRTGRLSWVELDDSDQ